MNRLSQRLRVPVMSPARIAVAVGVAATLPIVLAGTLPSSLARGLIVAATAGLVVAVVVFLMLRVLEDVQQEARDLWALSGAMTEGRPWPAPGGWALGAAALNLLYTEIRCRDLHTVVELGPGTSSIVLGRTLSDQVRMFGLEHDDDFFEIVRHRLREHDLTDLYSLFHAPLTEQVVAGKQVTWYSPDAWAQLPSVIDVLVVDGPPNWAGNGKRAPAWPVLESRLRTGSLVLVDDTQRRDERAMVAHWLTGGRLRVIVDAKSFVLLEVV